MSLVKRQAAMDAAIQQVFKDTSGDGEPGEEVYQGMLVGWIVVSEVMAPDGCRYLTVLSDDNTPVWTKMGMLEMGRELLPSEVADDEDDD